MESTEERVLILSGAGLSSLIDLPMTDGFSSLISKSAEFKLETLLQDFLGEGFNDVEKVMYALEEFIGKEPTSISKFLLSNEKHLPMQGSHARSKYEAIRTNSRIFLTELKTGIYDLLENFDLRKSEDLYINILGEIRKNFPNKKIVFTTTNYDLSFEKSLINNASRLRDIGLDDVDFGFRQKFGSLVFDFSIPDKIDPSILDYIKIHGSLDWHFDKHLGCTKAGANVRPRDPNNVPLLYPGFKGRPVSQPFVKLHDLFSHHLKYASHVIVVGFAFRDPYINEIFKHSYSINKNHKIYYFNRDPVEKLPRESGVPDFLEIFGTRFKYIDKPVENTVKPFGSSWAAP